MTDALSELAIFDLETTSPQPSTCAAVQVALFHVKFDDATGGLITDTIVDEIVDPGMDVSDGALAIHGITADQIVGKRPDYEVLAEVYDWLKAHPHVIVCGHNATTFDIPILFRCAQLANAMMKPEGGSIRGRFPLRIIDTLVIARRVLHTAPNHKLAPLFEWITGQPAVDAHDALGDCKMVLALLEYFGGALAMNIDEMAEYCATPRILKYCTMGKHRGKLWGRGEGCVPSGFVHWMCANFDDPGQDLIVTIREKYNMRFRKV